MRIHQLCIIGVIWSMLFAVACASSHKAGNVVSGSRAVESLDSALAASKWRMVSIYMGAKRLDVPTESLVSLSFERADKRIHGKCCNSYFGSYDLKVNKLSFSKVGATKMLCMGPLGEVEKSFFLLLKEEQTVSISSDTLTLNALSGRVTFVAEPKAVK